MKYTPVFSSVDSNALLTDILIRGSYGNLPCVFVVENRNWELYFPDSLFAKLGSEGYKNCFDKKFLPAYRKKTELAIKGLKQLISKKNNIAKFNQQQFLSFFKVFTAEISEFFKIYRITEFFHFATLEAELEGWAKKAFPKNATSVISDLISGKNMKAPANIKQITGFIREIQHLRFKMRETLNESFFGDSLFMALLEKIEILTGRHDFTLLTIDEINRVLKEDSVPDCSERVSLLAVYKEKGKWLYVTGAKAKKILRLVKLPVETTSTLKGTVASAGKARGVARVYAMGIEHTFENMKKSDILVAPTTGPEFMVAIQKAGAIVTDEGGLMSHAAVVSREFKIPCIVGTKIATKVLKDGELIEVDGKKGVVRKIKCP